MYTPHHWVVLKINNPTPFYRVLAGWNGGYLDGDSWRTNSGIASVKFDGEYYDFYGVTGSCYRCHKDTYRLGSMTGRIYNKAMEEDPTALEIMDENTDWLDFFESREPPIVNTHL